MGKNNIYGGLTPTKLTNFKMYKAGKKWMFVGASFIGAVAGSQWLNQSVVHADTTSITTSSVSISDQGSVSSAQSNNVTTAQSVSTSQVSVESHSSSVNADSVSSTASVTSAQSVVELQSSSEVSNVDHSNVYSSVNTSVSSSSSDSSLADTNLNDSLSLRDGSSTSVNSYGYNSATDPMIFDKNHLAAISQNRDFVFSPSVKNADGSYGAIVPIYAKDYGYDANHVVQTVTWGHNIQLSVDDNGNALAQNGSFDTTPNQNLSDPSIADKILTLQFKNVDFSNLSNTLNDLNTNDGEGSNVIQSFRNLRSVDYSNTTGWDKFTSLASFASSDTLSTINLGDSFDTHNVTDLSNFLSDAPRVVNVTFGKGFDTSNVKNFSNFIAGALSLQVLDLRNANFNLQSLDPNLTTYPMFNEEAGHYIYLGDHVGKLPSNLSSVMQFDGNSDLRVLDLGNDFDTSNVTNMQNLFSAGGYLQPPIQKLIIGGNKTRIDSNAGLNSMYVAGVGDPLNLNDGRIHSGTYISTRDYSSYVNATNSYQNQAITYSVANQLSVASNATLYSMANSYANSANHLVDSLNQLVNSFDQQYQGTDKSNVLNSFSALVAPIYSNNGQLQSLATTMNNSSVSNVVLSQAQSQFANVLADRDATLSYALAAFSASSAAISQSNFDGDQKTDPSSDSVLASDNIAVTSLFALTNSYLSNQSQTAASFATYDQNFGSSFSPVVQSNYSSIVSLANKFDLTSVVSFIDSAQQSYQNSLAATNFSNSVNTDRSNSIASQNAASIASSKAANDHEASLTASLVSSLAASYSAAQASLAVQSKATSQSAAAQSSANQNSFAQSLQNSVNSSIAASQSVSIAASQAAANSASIAQSIANSKAASSIHDSAAISNSIAVSIAVSSAKSIAASQQASQSASIAKSIADSISAFNASNLAQSIANANSAAASANIAASLAASTATSIANSKAAASAASVSASIAQSIANVQSASDAAAKAASLAAQSSASQSASIAASQAASMAQSIANAKSASDAASQSASIAQSIAASLAASVAASSANANTNQNNSGFSVISNAPSSSSNTSLNSSSAISSSSSSASSSNTNPATIDVNFKQKYYGLDNTKLVQQSRLNTITNLKKIDANNSAWYVGQTVKFRLNGQVHNNFVFSRQNAVKNVKAGTKFKIKAIYVYNGIARFLVGKNQWITANVNYVKL